MSWDNWESRADRGPWALFVGVLLFVFFAGLCIIPVSCTLGWFGDAANVVREETNPRTVLNRYMWFKDASATLDARNESIKLYEKRIENLQKSYEGKPRSEWARADAEQSNVWEMEVTGLKSSYNNLAAEYNSAMAKENYRFTNVGRLPEGAERPLPREYREYLTK